MTDALEQLGWRQRLIDSWEGDGASVLAPERWSDADVAAAITDGLAVRVGDGLDIRAGVEAVGARIAGWAVAADAVAPDEEDGFANRLAILVGLGAKHLVAFATGPDWDLGPFKELLAWRKARG